MQRPANAVLHLLSQNARMSYRIVQLVVSDEVLALGSIKCRFPTSSDPISNLLRPNLCATLWPNANSKPVTVRQVRPPQSMVVQLVQPVLGLSGILAPSAAVAGKHKVPRETHDQHLDSNPTYDVVADVISRNEIKANRQ